MGVRCLWDVLESCKQTLPLHHLQNKRLCIDLSCWIVQLQKSCKSNPKDKVFLKNLFHRVRALIALNCSLIFVTDGSIPSIKLATYRRRLGLTEGTLDESNPQSGALRRSKGSEFSCMIREAKALGMALGIPCLDALEEAEAQCAFLNSDSFCDGCFTLDSDAFLFGAKTVYRDIVLGEGGHVVCYEMKDIVRKLGFGRNSLIAMAVLLGSDYSQGVPRLGREAACRLIKSIGDDKVLLKIKSEGLAFVKKPHKQKKPTKDANKENECLFNAGGKKFTGPEDDCMKVISAYMNPKCQSPDSNVVQRLFTQRSFSRTQLHKVCEQFFEWTPEKTDEYILPKIAERDLRRFANLRSTSSTLGVRLPLEKMPVPCPVTSIVKERKVQGRAAFEVSWREIDGLKTSIVPADLVESACPEKIHEFMEGKHEAKKKQNRKPKPKKSTIVEMEVAELELKTSMLNIDSQSSFSNNSSQCRKSNNLQNLMENKLIIDLSSPSPPLCASKLVKRMIKEDEQHDEVIDICEVENLVVDKHVDVVDLCELENANAEKYIDIINIYESENDASSPEHEKKVRELRLFISSIDMD